MPFSSYQSFWSLDPRVTFLNHGAFGACPRPVLEAQQRWRDRLEAQPLKFLGREIEELLDTARSDLAAFVGAESGELAFIPNATTGVNAVLRSLMPQWGIGDELLTTNHEYNACRNALNYVAQTSGATIVVAEVPFPITDPEQMLEAVLAKVSERTRLVLVDHISSQTALIFPIASLTKALRTQGIEVLIDGAHAPGMIPLNLTELGATYYTGNCHKWLCAPKGAAFLYVQRDRQAQIRPLTISHGANDPRKHRSRFHLEFDWMGTGDPSAYLCVPEAIRFMGSLLPGGWPELMATNRNLALAARQVLCEGLAVPPPSPDEMAGAMVSIPLANSLPEDLYDRLVHEFQIEVPVIPWHPPLRRLIRVSAQVYNLLEQYTYLTTALKHLSVGNNFTPEKIIKNLQ
ncbi:MAG: aminotransferase class V-fold PLP-dependent enzyme [Leptolyngbyaceae cyanobacterium bins.59]|nr:aminotransferase class V-fold PLP-dependent enzyme [Leptolyngbyaceae cyanobacterium bins.59]